MSLPTAMASPATPVPVTATPAPSAPATSAPAPVETSPDGGAVGTRGPFLRLAWLFIPLAIALGLAAGAGAFGGAGRPPSLYQRTLQVAGQYRCPVCQGESVAASQAPEAKEIQGLIRGWLKQGRTEAQIRSFLVADYGGSILEKPSAGGIDTLLWVAPVVAVGLGAGGLGLAFRHWRRVGAPSEVGGALEREAGAAGHAGTASRGRRRFQRVTLVGGVALVVLAGALSLADHFSGPSLPGGTITGGATGIATELEQASALAPSDPAAALALYDRVLAAEPGQPVALTNEGWIYARAGFSAKALTSLREAERADPGYDLAHLYRGLVLLDFDGQLKAATGELEWYLAHGPDPSLAPLANEALARARAKSH
ncbi:MAG: cytochrome c-type biogenesis protein CcmH [Acidimicrobiales bacterium]